VDEATADKNVAARPFNRLFGASPPVGDAWAQRVTLLFELVTEVFELLWGHDHGVARRRRETTLAAEFSLRVLPNRAHVSHRQRCCVGR
jgi:hypothetical protein